MLAPATFLVYGVGLGLFPIQGSGSMVQGLGLVARGYLELFFLTCFDILNADANSNKKPQTSLSYKL